MPKPPNVLWLAEVGFLPIVVVVQRWIDDRACHRDQAECVCAMAGPVVVRAKTNRPLFVALLVIPTDGLDASGAAFAVKPHLREQAAGGLDALPHNGAVITLLAAAMASELPEVNSERELILKREAAAVLLDAQNEERDDSPLMVTPAIGVYTA